MKKVYLSLFITGFLLFSSCTELQQVANTVHQNTNSGEGLGNITNTQISSGLKEALNLGVADGISKLGAKDGFFGNSLTKILLPNELQQVDKTLRGIGLGSLADEGLKVLNRAAEDAVLEAAPIFTAAITSMSFSDAKNILLGGNGAATSYLEKSTTTQLVNAFKPKVANSLDKVGANNIWAQIISRYNGLTGKNITTDLNSYVSEQAVDGVFKMVAEKENGIRGNTNERTSSLLQKVFALQDK